MRERRLYKRFRSIKTPEGGFERELCELEQHGSPSEFQCQEREGGRFNPYDITDPRTLQRTLKRFI